MNSHECKRGSNWRKWDLHVHTKGTAKNDQFTSSNFDAFCIILFKKALEKEICAIGITDYFSVANYKKVKKYISNIDSNESFTKEEKEKIEQILILPNVELRMLPVTDSGRLVNIHCIFNPSFETFLENDFFGSIEYSARSGHKYKMNKQGLIGLGNYLDSNLSEENAQYKKGVDSFVVSHESLLKLWDENSNFRENTIIAVSNSSSDGASAFQKHYDFFEDTESGSLDAVRKAIYCMSQAIFSGNKEDRKYFLGEKKDDIKIVKNKCGSLKPCIHGSDAHTEEKLFSPDQERYCWIKANSTFEGLKQIIYEPDDRVKIQEFKPEEKDMYQLIDKVKFIDDSFMPNELLINQNLTTIIGGKSTGKSILLRNIAQSVDSYEVTQKLNEVDLKPYSKEVNGFRVVWKDKQESNKEADDVNKKIIYIPQSYLNRIVEKEGKRSAVDNIIENILKQEVEAVYNELSSFGKMNNQKIANNIASLFNLMKDGSEQKEKIKNTGDRKGIELELKILEGQIAELKKTSGLSDEEIAEYDEYVNQIKSLTSQIEMINSDKIELEQLKQENILQEISFDNLSSNLKNEMEAFYNKLKVMVAGKWKTEIDDKIKIQLKELEAKQETLSKIKGKFEPLLERARKVKALDEKIKQIEIQQGNLKQIQGEEKLLEAIRSKFHQTIANLADAHSQFYEKYLASGRKILEQDVISGDLKFHLDVRHKTQSFQNDFIKEVFDGRQLPAEFSEYKFKDKDVFSKDVEELINKILYDKIVLKQRYTKQEALTKLLQNWYMFDYQIKQGGDNISDMSPGKKSFVLLKLLIELDNSKCPILLDQPEDDLDNRSIYEDLVKFVKNKKKGRQIIIVTHNPNLVVGADAECVIVANQEGTYSKNKGYQFEYISGALENTFIHMDESKTLYKQGIQEHVCDILEGGDEAFKKRRQRYGRK